MENGQVGQGDRYLGSRVSQGTCPPGSLQMKKIIVVFKNKDRPSGIEIEEAKKSEGS
jgi:hypothetical protein